MDPQQNKPQAQVEQPIAPLDMVEEPTQPTQFPVMEPHKSHKRAVVLALLGVVLIGAALTAYLIYFQMNAPTTTETTQQTPASQAVSPVDSTTEVLTDGATAEDQLTSTDDTSDVDDASKAAGNVGDSINESNF